MPRGYPVKGLGSTGLALARFKEILMFPSDMLFCNGAGLVYFSLQQVILSADPPPLQGFGPRNYWTLSTVKFLNKMTSTLIPMARAQTLTHTINLDPELKFPKVQECLDLGPTHFPLSAGWKPRGGEQTGCQVPQGGLVTYPM